MEKFDINSQLIKEIPKLNKLALLFTKNKMDAEDLVSDVCLKILENKELYKHNNKFSCWCSMILKNTFINKYRKDKIKNELFLDFDPYQVCEKFNIIQADTNILYDELIKQFDLSIFENKILYAYIMGYQYNQLSEIFELPEGTIKSKIFQARKKLKNKLSSNYLNC